jgi:hypothetical protein
MSVAEMIKKHGAVPSSPTSSISATPARPASSAGLGDKYRPLPKPGSSRTQFRVSVEETDDGIPSPPRNISESISSATNGVSNSSELTSSIQEPILVSIEAANDEFPVEEVSQDEDLYPLNETRTQYRRSMTPGPSSQIVRHSFDVEMDDTPDIPEFRSPDAFKDSRDAEWNLDHDDTWRSVDSTRGMGALPSRVILQEVHPHDQAARARVHLRPLEEADHQKRQQYLDIMEGFNEALPGGLDREGENWFYCRECCAWGRAQADFSSDYPRTYLGLMAAGLPYKHDAEQTLDQDMLELGDEAWEKLKSEPEMEVSSIYHYNLNRTSWSDFCAGAVQAERSHPRSHHLHCMPGLAGYDITSSILQEPSAYPHTGPIVIGRPIIEPRPRMDVWHCCQCRFMVQTDRQLVIPGALTPEIIQRLLERDPPLNSAETGEERLRGALSLMAV